MDFRNDYYIRLLTSVFHEHRFGCLTHPKSISLLPASKMRFELNILNATVQRFLGYFYFLFSNNSLLYSLNVCFLSIGFL